MFDVEALLQPISEEAPCGEDLSYDPAYMELERTAQGTPEQEIGDTKVEAEEPNWREVRDQALALLNRTRDLRVIMQLTIASLRLDGVEGLRAGLALLHGALDRYWDTVHPILDPDDDFDPLERINIIAAMSPPAGSDVSQDPMKFIPRLREAPLSNSKQMGRFGYRDILVARGEISAGANSDDPPPDLAVIDASFEDTEIEELQARHEAIEAAAELVTGVDAALTQRVGPSQAPDLSGFVNAVKEVGKCLQGYLAQRGYGAAPEAEAEAGGGGGGGGPSLSGEINSTQDVLMAMDKVCRYYERFEPSSPVPLLIRRAQRLVSKSFVEIIQDLTPDAMRQIEMISGSDNT